MINLPVRYDGLMFTEDKKVPEYQNIESSKK